VAEDVDGDIEADKVVGDGLTIGGDVDGTIEADKVVGDGLTIGGELGGDFEVDDVVAQNVTVDIGSLADEIDIDIYEMESGAKFRIKGDVPANSEIWIRKLGENIDIDMGYGQSGDYDMDGTLVIVQPPGIPDTTEITIFGDLGGDLDMRNFLDGTVTVLGNVEPINYSKVGISLSSYLDDDGSITVGDAQNASDLKGCICVYGNTVAGGSIKVEGDISSTGRISIGSWSDGSIDVDGDCAGSIDIGTCPGGGDIRGRIDIGGELSGDITASAGTGYDGHLEDDIVVSGPLSGDIDLDGDVKSGASISVKRLAGRILIDGTGDGAIIIKRKTTSTSLIRMITGLGANGTIEINQEKLTYNANGDVWIGEPEGELVTVWFDGCIRIYKDYDTGSDGDLNGDITVRGCHLTDNSLIIQIDGHINGTIDIQDEGCEHQPGLDTDGPCP